MAKQQYVINKNTLAIVPGRGIEVSALVYEKSGQVASEETPLAIVKDNCLEHGASYEGRRDAVIHRFNFKRKTPITVCELQDIYAFPTHAVTSADCMWLFGNHIVGVYPLAKNACEVLFQNGLVLACNASEYVVNKQWHRMKVVRGERGKYDYYERNVSSSAFCME